MSIFLLGIVYFSEGPETSTLKEYVNGSEINKCLQMGSYVASQIIQKVGARLEKI